MPPLSRLLFVVLIGTGCPVTQASVDTGGDTDIDTDTQSVELACDGSAPTTVTRDGGEWRVAPNDSWRGCATADDCVAVDTLCSECCDYTAICGDLRQRYLDEKWNTHCVGFDGGVCDCEPTPFHLECQTGRCVVVLD